MICLGIEGTAHTCGVGIVDEKANILANELDMERNFYPRLREKLVCSP